MAAASPRRHLWQQLEVQHLFWFPAVPGLNISLKIGTKREDVALWMFFESYSALYCAFSYAWCNSMFERSCSIVQKSVYKANIRCLLVKVYMGLPGFFLFI